MSSDEPSPDDLEVPDETVAYDKAKWHYDGSFPRWTRKRQAFVHTGYFLAWLADRDLVSPLLASEDADRVAAIRVRRGRPDDLYAAWDGVLVSSMLTDEANAFTRDYYERLFLEDYARVFSEAGPYKVRASWQNYDRIAPVLDERLAEWRSETTGSRAGGLRDE